MAVRASINPPKVKGPPKGVVRPPTPVPGKGVLRPGSTGYVAPPQTTPGATAAAAPANPWLELPPDPIYTKAVEGLGKTRAETVGGLEAQRKGQLLAFGYSEVPDPAGDPTKFALSFDPNNPFSKASLLKQEYDVGRAKKAHSMAATGQMYAGAAQNAQDYINRQQLGAEDTLQKQLTAWLLQNTQDVATAGTTYETGVQDEDEARVGRLLTGDNPLYNPTLRALQEATKPAPAAAKPTPAQTAAKAQAGAVRSTAAAEHAEAVAKAKAKVKKKGKK
jgi:hypothetical protein